MVDTKPMAQEKAKQRAAELKAERESIEAGRPVKLEAPPGSGVMSERQRAKMAARAEDSTYDGTGIRKIAAFTESETTDRILRVAAYCRVSTDDIEQLISIEDQKRHYKELISKEPNWKNVGTYVDDGFSGTNTEHRPAFRMMMRDAMAGKIDMIITKSVSRFARNLLDCISWVRKLQAHDPPIAVKFEQEGLNTLDPSSSIILFVLAMVAEEESHMKSEAMLLSLEWRLSRGRFLTPALLGYDKERVVENGIEKKKLVINPDQAQTVRLMYYMLLNGSSTKEIADTLTDLGRETGGRQRDGTINTHWSSSGVSSVMRNERYCGDVLARKTWTPNFHDHKAVKNRGKKNRYYQSDHHDAIITRAQWNAAQKILNSRRFSGKCKYQPLQVIDHGALRGYISVNTHWNGFEDEEYYRVSSIAMGLRDGVLDMNLENEHLPDGGHKLTGLTDEGGIQRIARELSKAEKEVKAELEGKTLEELEREEAKPEKVGFQVVNGSMFSHAFEPVMRISGSKISFNSTCVSKLNHFVRSDTSVMFEHCLCVELLYNPVERMLAVRPCSPEHPNAIHWCKVNGQSKTLYCTAFCRMLFRMLNWDESYTFRLPAIVRERDGQKCIFFDLDNYIGHETFSSDYNSDHPEIESPMTYDDADEGRGFFYAAEDDENPVELDIEPRLEALVNEYEEAEKRNFGIPLFEHDSASSRLPAVDEMGEWDVMTEAIVLGSDHSVDEETVQSLHDTLEDALYTTCDEEDDEE